MIAHLAAKSSPAVFAEWIADRASAVMIAETTVGAAPVGYAVVTIPDLPVELAPGDLELRRIYVLAPFHRSGVGAALMSGALDSAQAMSATRMLLGVHGGNTRAQRFYERSGFAVIGTRQFQVGAVVHDDLIYARAL